VPLGFELDRFGAIDDNARASARAALGVPPDALVVTTVGRLTAIKDHELFLDAAKRILTRAPATIFLIAGDGELRSALESRAAALGIDDRGRFLGWRRDLDVLYAATDVFLLTSRNEGTPVALIESLAAGCAAVSTDVGGVRDVISGVEMGRVAPPGDAAQLADHVVALLADGTKRRAMGADGRRSVLARYGLDRLLADIHSLYEEVLGEPAVE
jgi:glycosyltransferase involved in cell wall biosynthesis